MFTPLRPSIPGLDSLGADSATKVVLALQADGQEILVDHDGFTIGSSRQCDFTLAEPAIPTLHSVIHLQAGAIWIEAANDDTMLIVNNRPYRRMALRHDDRLKIGMSEFTVRMHAEKNQIAEEIQATVNEELSLLTAEELCDRILSEQSAVAEFTEGRRSGWEALMRAIEEANAEDQSAAPLSTDEAMIESVHEQVAFDTLLAQIQQLNEEITDRTRELSQQESEVLASTSMLDEAQERVNHRLDEILDQLNQSDPPSELRASA